ncbi:hypothetical protein [Rhabdothermincola sediminis]|uniref:hypothetical protein n=1 Tax=Rhabdothermincola sediminis TaxID=2751370 RepID=UPI001AA08D64|nr:hypothetical protein [Rhabdothermincola sediminis]
MADHEQADQESRAPTIRRRRAVLIFVAAVVVAATVAALAEVESSDRNAEGGATVPTERVGSEPTTTLVSQLPDGYIGEVHVEVRPMLDGIHVVELRWGPWRRTIVHDDSFPASYHFAKKDLHSPPLVVAGSGVSVAVGTGQGAAPSNDVNDGWNSSGSTE